MEECDPKMLSAAYQLAGKRYPKGTQITLDMIEEIITELKAEADKGKRRSKNVSK